MSNSATGGYLAPLTSPPYDAALDAILQAAIVGITGLPGGMVRKSWQGIPSPPADTDWCAFAVTAQPDQLWQEVRHDPAGDGIDILEYDEDIELRCAFYGSAARGYAARLRDGLNIAQNRDVLKTHRITFEGASAPRYVPELINQTVWLSRCDIELAMRRRCARTYAIRNLLSSTGTVEDDAGSETSWNTET
jgi:hypothetical protein